MTEINQRERAYRAAVYEVNGIGPQRFGVLLKYFSSAEKVWKAPMKKIRETGLSKDAVKKFEERRKKVEPVSHLKALAKLGIRVVLAEDDEYPKLLKEIESFPQVLFVRGQFKSEDGKAMAVVGTRKPTSYGRAVTEKFVEQLVAQGFTIVSGLARGIDGIAHRVALEAGGRTIGVLGGGVDRVYPPEHVGLAEKISQHGAVISEFTPGELPVPGNFPARNRVISGLALGVLVVEGASKSGTKITASLAAQQGREVFAIPGPITSRFSQAPADLIKLGAKVVTTVSDILEELSVQDGPGYKGVSGKSTVDIASLEKNEREIVELLENEQMHVDEMVRKLKKDTAQVSSTLTMLELKRVVRHLGGWGLLFGVRFDLCIGK